MSRTILMTGAAGGVATAMRPLLRARYDDLLLSDLHEITDLAPGERSQAADLADPAALESLTRGVHTVIHLGGQSVEADWRRCSTPTSLACTTPSEACRKSNVERIVFASSNHAIGMYSRQQRIGSDHRVRPDSRYGLSKAFGEGMAAMYADKHGMRALSIRIGNVSEAPADRRRLSIWIHPEDLMQLFAIGVRAPGSAPRDRLRRIRQPAQLVGQHRSHPPRLPAAPPRRGPCAGRAGRRRASRPDWRRAAGRRLRLR